VPATEMMIKFNNLYYPLLLVKYNG